MPASNQHLLERPRGLGPVAAKDASPHVNVIHVRLCSDYSSALVTWGSGVEELVPIVGGHGQLEFLPAPID